MVPLLEFSSSSIVEPVPFSAITSLLEPAHLVAHSPENPMYETISSNFFLQHFLMGIYVLGVIIHTVRFSVNLIHIYGMGRKCRRVTYKNAQLVLMPKPVLPFTFASMIFVAKADYEKGLLEPELLAHELAHVRQFHSLDLILVELFAIVFWFNPLENV